MKIINSESFSSLEHIQKKKELISNIVDAVFSISKVDKNLQINEKVKIEEIEILKIKEKIKKQVEVLEKISSLKNSLSRKVSYLSSENSNLQSKLLCKLGVEV
jgi:neutral trehalase